MTRNYDLTLFGATGFTGKLVTEYLGKRLIGGSLNWAIAGRDPAKLENLKNELQLSCEIIIADSNDPQSLKNLAQQSKVICSTVGPYAKFGSELVAACAQNGTHYCDITGESQWIRTMIDQHEKSAQSSGARIVHCCGFDSIPFEVGVFELQNFLKDTTDKFAQRIEGRLIGARGKFSGGTVASILNILDEVSKTPGLAKQMRNPYFLNPDPRFDGPKDYDLMKPMKDKIQWNAPFLMAPTNTRIVRRGHALRGFPYGNQFSYNEAMATGKGASGRLKAWGISLSMSSFIGLHMAAGVRRFSQKYIVPKSGQGPSREEQDKGFFKIRFYAYDQSDNLLATLDFIAQGDPGYKATSMMLAESALCLCEDAIKVDGGSWTPVSCFGELLTKRLKDQGFHIESKKA